MKRVIACVALLGILFQGCDRRTASDAAPPVELNVFAAASLTESFQDIGNQFASANPGIIVRFNFAGSQDLRAQLENGAQADLFASANEKEMSTAATEGLVNQQTVRDFAQIDLVLQ